MTCIWAFAHMEVTVSAFSVNNNVPALMSARWLNINTDAVTRSLARISSNLRIVTAADDPAGLQVSERLRAQYRGLTRASLNAQDGVSLMQTASGALSEITALLQNIRELAVSAADGDKTNSDRLAIQEEVSQYIDEIQRIAGQTEFNTKRLLDGSLGAFIHTSDFNRLQGSLAGEVGVGGSFIIKPRVKDPGVLQRVVSDVFTITGSGDMPSPVSALTTLRPAVALVTDDGTGTGNTGVYRYELPNTANGSLALKRFLSYGNNLTLSVAASTVAAVNAAGVSFAEVFEAEEISAGDYVRFTFNNVSVVTLSIAVSAATDINTWAATTLDNAMSAAGLAFATGLATGELQLSLNGGVTLTGVTFVDKDNSGSQIHLSFNASTGTVESNILHTALSLTLVNNGVSFSANVTKSGANDRVISLGNASTGALHIRFDPFADFESGGALSLTDQFTLAQYGGGNNLATYVHTSFSGSAVANGSYLVSAISNRTFAIYSFNNARYTSLVNSGTDQDTAVLAAKGNRFFVDGSPATSTFSVGAVIKGELLDDATNTNPLTGLRLTFSGALLQPGERGVFDVSTTSSVRAGATTTLQSIAAVQASGAFSGASYQTLYLYFSGREGSTSVNVYKTDTLEDVAAKLSLALWDGNGGGLAGGAGTLVAAAPPQLARFNAVGSSRGTLSLAAPAPGLELVLTGNEDLLDALGFDTAAAAQAPTYSVAAYRADTGQFVRSVLTQDDEVHGLVPGVALRFDNTVNLRLDAEPPTGDSADDNTTWPYYAPDETPALSITAPASAEDFMLTVTPNPLVFQIGANGGQTMRAFIPDVGARALGIAGLNVATLENAGAAIGTVDQALERVGGASGRVGGYQNSLEAHMRFLDVAAENTLAAESRIRDVDYASEIIALTRAQALAAASAFALAQANLLPQSVLRLLS